MLKLSHISCRVDNLYEVAKQVEEMGFTIEWGGLPGKENNFFIWFGDEAFLEVFCIKRKFAPLVVAMQLVYGTVPAKKWWRWFSAKNMWCDFALEDDNDNMTKIVRKNKKTIVDIESIKKYVKDMGINVAPKTLHWKRKNCKGKYANYSYFSANDILDKGNRPNEELSDDEKSLINAILPDYDKYPIGSKLQAAEIAKTNAEMASLLLLDERYSESVSKALEESV